MFFRISGMREGTCSFALKLIKQGKNIILVNEIPVMGDAYELEQLIANMCFEHKPQVSNVDSGNLGEAFIDILQRMTEFRICADK